MTSEQQHYLNTLTEDMKGHMRSIWRGLKRCSTRGLREAYQECGPPYPNLFMRLRQTMIGHELKRRGAL
jgi:hypothetical protein